MNSCWCAKRKALCEIRDYLILLEKPVVRIVDLGCGKGAFVYHVQQMVKGLSKAQDVKHGFYGLDYSEIQIEKAKSRVSGVQFMTGDLNTGIPFLKPF